MTPPVSRTLTEKLIDPILATDPAGPRVTYYDDANGERVELSTVTLMNWAAKTANMIRDEFGGGQGTRVRIDLPAHWQTAAVLLGCWWAGCEVLTGPSDEPPALAFVAQSRLAADHAGGPDADELLVLSLDAFGRPAADLPVGTTDYATTVRMHGDQYMPERIEGEAPALDGVGIADTADRARTLAGERGITDADRVLSTAAWENADGIIAGLLAPLAAGASLVQVNNLDPEVIDARIENEKITLDLR